MKIKKLFNLGAALLVALYSLFAINLGQAFAAGNSCTWTGTNGNNFNDAGNWSSCGSTVPGTGDTLVFPANMTTRSLTNDLVANTSFAGVQFTGDASTGGCNNDSYSITGNAITLTGNITDSMTNCSVEQDLTIGITLGADVVLDQGNDGFTFDALNLSTHNFSTTGNGVDTSIYGAISGSGNITFDSALFNTLGADNPSWTGSLIVTAGALDIDYGDSIPTGGAIFNNYMTRFDPQGTNMNITSPVTFNGTVDSGIPSLQTSGNATSCSNVVTFSGTVTVSSATLFGGPCSVAITGPLQGAGKITVADGYAGSLTVASSNNTNTGPTPNGVYKSAIAVTTISDSQPAQTETVNAYNQYVIDGTRGDVTVQDAGILKGSGTVGVLDVQSGGTVAPGHSPGCMNSGNLTIAGTYQAEIGGTTACTGYDQLNVTGTVNLTGGTLTTSLYNNYKPKAGETYTIIKNDGSDAVTGTFAGLPEGTTFKVSGYVFQITYKGGTGNDVVLTVKSVPTTPNTGFGLITANPMVTLIGASLMAGGFWGLSKKAALAGRR